MRSSSIRFLPFLLVAFLLSACTPAADVRSNALSENYPSQFLAGDVYVLKSQERINGNIVGFDTTLIIEEGASVLGDINLFASKMEVAGSVSGEINLFGGESRILDSAVISGSINQIANGLSIEPNATIYGEINSFSAPDSSRPENIQLPEGVDELLKPQTWVIIQIVRNVVLIFFNMLVVFLFKDQTIRVMHHLRNEPLVSWIIGIVTLIALPLVAVVFIITICLSPIGLLLFLLLGVGNLWGWTITSYFAGMLLAHWFKIEPNEIGTVVIGSVFFGIIFTLASFIPFLIFILSAIISAFGLGAIVHYLLKGKK